MGYLGQAASFTGTQNNKRVSATATAGQVDFLPEGGYNINAIDVYRNGVKLVGQKDFTALDGVTVTLTQGASENDSLEFVIFENFAVNDVVTTDGDSVIRGNLQVNGDLGIVGGTLSATVAEARNLAVGATAYGINASGVITATSFSGDGSALTGIAATDNVSTSGLVVAGISTFNSGISVTGVVTATSFSGSGANLTGIAVTDNVSTSGLVVAGISTFNSGISVTGVVTATSFTGSGANLTNLPSGGGGLNELEATLFG